MADLALAYAGMGLLIILPLSSLFLLLSALRLESISAQILNLTRELREDERYTHEDDTWVNYYLDDARDSSIRIIALISPILLLLGPVLAVSIARSYIANGKDDALASMRREIDHDELLLMEAKLEKDIPRTPLFGDPRKRLLGDLAQKYQAYRHPFALTFICIFSLPALIAFLVAGVILGLGLNAVGALTKRGFQTILQHCAVFLAPSWSNYTQR